MRLAAGLLTTTVALSGCLIGDDPFEEQAATTTQVANATGAGDSSGVGNTNTAFFASLGSNGRSCGSCHVAGEGWTITPAGVQARFDATAGTDPIFRTNDGSNCDTIDTSTVEKRAAAYSMLRTKGLIRVSMPIPANADFTLIAVDDPYKCANAANVSLFRRPLPSTNLRFLSTLMWDGRESKFNTPGDLTSFNLAAGLGQQAIDATMGHAQATGTKPTDMNKIVSFETPIHTAQVTDNNAGALDSGGAQGGLAGLANAQFFYGINDSLGLNPTGAAFNPRAMTMFDAWQNSSNASQRAIFRGQEVFNTRQFTISGVKGLNDTFGVPSFQGTCTSCHDTPFAGNHSLSLAIDIGLTDVSRRTPDMPLYTFRENSTGAIVKSTDPGRAMITGKFADIGKFKGAILRGLQLRAPYFHNGSAATLADAVSFYNQRFGINLTNQERSDLIAFLSAL
jgi:cytochrome c peroxidase